MDTYLTLSFCLACLWTLMGGLFLYFVYRIMKATERPVGRLSYGPSKLSDYLLPTTVLKAGTYTSETNDELKRINEMLDRKKAERSAPSMPQTEAMEVHEGNLCEEVMLGTNSPDTIRRMSGSTNKRKEG